MQTTAEELPECLTRDHLTSEYFPNLSRTGLYAIIAMSLVFCFTSLHRLNHTDLWGHLSFGRWIAEEGKLPVHDPFAVHGEAASVINYAWLGQWIGYSVHHIGGADGLILGHALLETLAAGIIMLAVARRGATSFWPALAGISFVVLSLPIMGTIRPQLFAQVCMALTFLALSELPKKKHPLIWLPVVFILWVNLHATMLMGLVAIAAVTAGLGNVIWEKTKNLQAVLADEVVRRHLIALALATVAGACSPLGPAIYWRVGTFSRSTMLSTITEWQALNPASLTGGLLIFSALLAFFVFRQQTKPLPWGEVALLGLFGLATVSAIRMLVWWSLAWPWVVVPLLAEWLSPMLAPTTEEDEKPTAMRTLVALGVIFTTILFAPPTHSMLHGRQRGVAMTHSTETPYYVTDELVRRDLSGSFFAPMDWADYMLWRSNGKLKPLAYGHIHLSSPEVWDAYREIYIGDASWLRAVRENQVKYIVAARERNNELIKKLRASEAKGESRIIYQDQKSVVSEIYPERKKAKAKDEKPSEPGEKTEEKSEQNPEQTPQEVKKEDDKPDSSSE